MTYTDSIRFPIYTNYIYVYHYTYNSIGLCLPFGSKATAKHDKCMRFTTFSYTAHLAMGGATSEYWQQHSEGDVERQVSKHN